MVGVLVMLWRQVHALLVQATIYIVNNSLTYLAALVIPWRHVLALVVQATSVNREISRLFT